MDYSDAPDDDLPSTPMSPTDTIVLSDSASLGQLDLLGARVDFEVQFEMLLPSEVPPVVSSGVKVPHLRQPSVLGASIAGGSGLTLVPSARGKEHVVYPASESSLESHESDSPTLRPPPVKPA